MRLKDALSSPTLKEYVPDIMSAVAFLLIVGTIKLRYPAKIGLLITLLLRRLRIQQMPNHLLVSIDGIPSNAWSVRIPTRRLR